MSQIDQKVLMGYFAAFIQMIGFSNYDNSPLFALLVILGGSALLLKQMGNVQ